MKTFRLTRGEAFKLRYCWMCEKDISDRRSNTRWCSSACKMVFYRMNKRITAEIQAQAERSQRVTVPAAIGDETVTRRACLPTSGNTSSAFGHRIANQWQPVPPVSRSSIAYPS